MSLSIIPIVIIVAMFLFDTARFHRTLEGLSDFLMYDRVRPVCVI